MLVVIGLLFLVCLTQLLILWWLVAVVEVERLVAVAAQAGY
jgi:hypothetical protein